MKKILQIEEKLERHYGQRACETHGQALDVLISTILSQNTSDLNSSRAFDSLTSAYSDWAEVAQISPAAIRRTISSGGLAYKKSACIQTVLKTIKESYGAYSLDKLKHKNIQDKMQFLTSIPGVGEKTAACVLLFAWGDPVMPVDTHIHRITIRLGLTHPSTDRKKTFQFWFDQKQVVDYYTFHLNLVKHGRLICRARKPDCKDCVIKANCKYFKKRT